VLCLCCRVITGIFIKPSPSHELPSGSVVDDVTRHCQLNLLPEDPPFRKGVRGLAKDRKSTRLNSSHDQISYAVFCLKKKSMHRYVHMNTLVRNHGYPPYGRARALLRLSDWPSLACAAPPRRKCRLLLLARLHNSQRR